MTAPVLRVSYTCSECCGEVECEDYEFWVCSHCKVWFKAPEEPGQRFTASDCDCSAWDSGPHDLKCRSMPPVCEDRWHDHPEPEPGEGVIPDG